MSSKSKDKSKFDGRIGLLKIFAEIVNPTDSSEIGLTLNVHGTIVSGLMIGIKRYYEEVGKTFVDGINSGSPEEASRVKEEFTMLFDSLKLPPTEKELEEGLQFNHIYLKNPKIYGTRVFSPPFWIGKIESVDGFFLGILQEET